MLTPSTLHSILIVEVPKQGGQNLSVDAFNDLGCQRHHRLTETPRGCFLLFALSWFVCLAICSAHASEVWCSMLWILEDSHHNVFQLHVHHICAVDILFPVLCIVVVVTHVVQDQLKENDLL